MSTVRSLWPRRGRTLCALGTALAASTALASQTITLQSGNGAVNALDSQIRYTASTGCCAPLKPTPFVAADFTAAQTGPFARIVTAYPGWIVNMGECPNSQWVAVDLNRTPKSTLYAIPFNVTVSCISQVNMSICWSVDDVLGDPAGNGPNSAGLYVNGTALPASSGGNFTTQTCRSYNLTGLVTPGTNWLYLYDRDGSGVVSGLRFCATIQVEDLTGFVGGVKFDDANCNGVRDSGETGMSGWTIVATNTVTGQTYTVTTGAGGSYSFSNLPLGTYTVTEIQQPGWRRTLPRCREYTINLNCQNRDIGGIDFGNCRCQGGTFTNLATGINDATNSLLPPGSVDDTWRLVCRPSSVPAGGPFVVPTPGYWGSQSGSTWISATTNGQLFTLPQGDYCYEACFDWCGCHQIVLSLSIICDDTATVLLNGTSVGTVSAGPTTPTTITVNNAALFRDGSNCVTIVCRNIPQAASPSGINVNGFVESGEGGCCGDCPCARPPTGMTGWWRFEESATSAFAFDLAGTPNTGTYVGSPAVAVGEVGKCRQFNGSTQYVNVPTHVDLNPGTGSFTIDAWIRTTQTTGLMSIVEKAVYSTGTPPLFNPVGYQLYLSAGQLNASLLAGTFNTENFTFAGPSLADGCWHHVAWTVIRGAANGSKLFVDGNMQAFNTSIGGSVSTGAPLRIANSSQGTQFFNGLIDEVEFFKRALTPAEVDAIYRAGSDGKCRNLVYVQPLTGFCINNSFVDVPFTICNNSTTTQSYSWSYTALASGAGCNISATGSTFTTIPAGSSATIPPGSCINRTVRITRPTAMTFNGAFACWNLNVVNTTSGATVTTTARINDIRNSCGIICLPCTATTAMFPGTSVSLPATISGVSGIVPLRARAVITPNDIDSGDPNMLPAGVSLNGLPPGEPVLGTFDIPQGGSVNFPITVDLGYDADSFNNFSLLIEADLDGDGQWETLNSRMVQVQHTLTADLNGDCAVNLTDLSILLGQFGAAGVTFDQGDVTGDGLVDLGDLSTLLANFGRSCP